MKRKNDKNRVSGFLSRYDELPLLQEVINKLVLGSGTRLARADISSLKAEK